MIPLTLFLLACGAMYLGTIQAAFNALMRVSLQAARRGQRPRARSRKLSPGAAAAVPPASHAAGPDRGICRIAARADDRDLDAGLVPAAGGLDGGLWRDLRISRAVSDCLERSRARSRAAAAKLPDARPPAGAAYRADCCTFSIIRARSARRRYRSTATK